MLDSEWALALALYSRGLIMTMMMMMMMTMISSTSLWSSVCNILVYAGVEPLVTDPDMSLRQLEQVTQSHANRLCNLLVRAAKLSPLQTNQCPPFTCIVTIHTHTHSRQFIANSKPKIQGLFNRVPTLLLTKNPGLFQDPMKNFPGPFRSPRMFKYKEKMAKKVSKFINIPHCI